MSRHKLYGVLKKLHSPLESVPCLQVMVAKRYEYRSVEASRLADLQGRGPAHPSGDDACCMEAFYSPPVPRDHGPHAAGLQAQQPGDNETARSYLSEGYRLRGAAGVRGRKEAGLLHRKPL